MKYIRVLGVHTNTDFRLCSVLLDGLKGILRALFALLTCATEPENLGKFTSVLIIYMQSRCFLGGGRELMPCPQLNLELGLLCLKVQDNLRTLVRKTGKSGSFSRPIRERLIRYNERFKSLN